MGKSKNFKSFISRSFESIFNSGVWEGVKWLLSNKTFQSAILTFFTVWGGRVIGWFTTMNVMTAYTVFIYLIVFSGFFSTISLIQIKIKSNNLKKNASSNSFNSITDEIRFHPRKTKQDPDEWESVDTKVWLEVTGTSELKKYSAILRKLETENNGISESHLSEVTNSLSPRLKISRERIFVAEQKNSDYFICLMDDRSGALPKGRKYYIEVDLMKGLVPIKKFRGYLIHTKYGDIEIKDYFSEI